MIFLPKVTCCRCPNLNNNKIDTRSGGDWIKRKIEVDSVAASITVFESSDKQIPLPPPQKFERERLQYWFTHLLTSLDCYIWLFAGEAPAVQPAAIFVGDQSQLFPSLVHFIAHFAQTPSVIRKSEQFQALTPSELEKYNYLKTRVILRLFHFTILLMEKFPSFAPNLSPSDSTASEKSKKSAASEPVTSANWFGGGDGKFLPKFFQLVANSILCPISAQIGFNYEELEAGAGQQQQQQGTPTPNNNNNANSRGTPATQQSQQSQSRYSHPHICYFSLSLTYDLN